MLTALNLKEIRQATKDKTLNDILPVSSTNFRWANILARFGSDKREQNSLNKNLVFLFLNGEQKMSRAMTWFSGENKPIAENSQCWERSQRMVNSIYRNSVLKWEFYRLLLPLDFANSTKQAWSIREGTYLRILLGAGGGPGIQRGGSVVNFLQIGEGKPVLFSIVGGAQFFLARKIFTISLLFCTYKQSYQSWLIQIIYRCGQFIYKKLSSPNWHNCLSRPVSIIVHILMLQRGVLV